MERFRSLNSLQLIRDNKTRWHSYYNMCKRALLVKDALTTLLAQEIELVAETLNATDWDHLTHLT